MRQCRAVLIVTREVKAAGVDLIRVRRFLACQLAHERIRLAALPGAIEIARKTVGDPHIARRERQAAALNFRRLRVVPLVFQLFCLGSQLLVGQATFNIINTAALAGGERLNKLCGLLR